MSIRPDDELKNRDVFIEDSYEKVGVDTLLLMERLKIVKNKMRNTPWYRIGTRMKSQKELSCIQKETDEIAERLKILDTESRNLMQIVKRP